MNADRKILIIAVDPMKGETSYERKSVTERNRDSGLSQLDDPDMQAVA